MQISLKGVMYTGQSLNTVLYTQLSDVGIVCRGPRTVLTVFCAFLPHGTKFYNCRCTRILIVSVFDAKESLLLDNLTNTNLSPLGL